MEEKDFYNFMRSQVKEIIDYRQKKLKTCPDINLNECVFEWIENHAYDFRKNWHGKK